jgi:orotidine-5'-phosphate decarboxylase
MTLSHNNDPDATVLKHHEKRLILALDEPTLADAEDMALRLMDDIIFFKIGLTLLSQGGLDLAQKLKDNGKLIFQDWKLNDIGAQIEGATKAISKGPCDILTVHAHPQVMKAALQGREDTRTKIIGVTVLTSLNDHDVRDLGYFETTADLVKRRVDQAVECGIDGVVASPHEALMIKSRVPTDFLIITPGVRPKGANIDDQQRIATPKSALNDGATHIVVGRPITRANDVRLTARDIISQMQD